MAKKPKEDEVVEDMAGELLSADDLPLAGAPRQTDVQVLQLLRDRSHVKAETLKRAATAQKKRLGKGDMDAAATLLLDEHREFNEIEIKRRERIVKALDAALEKMDR